MSLNAVSDTLPFSPTRQEAVLGHLLTNARFFKQCVDAIQPSWFVDPNVGRIWQAAIAQYKDFKHIPTLPEIKEGSGFSGQENGVRNRMNIKLQECLNATATYRLNTLTDDLTLWLHCRYFHEGFLEGEQLYNRGQFDEAYSLMEQKIRNIRTTSFHNEIEFNFENFVDFFMKRDLDAETALTFGSSAFDRLLLPRGKGNGSLLLGDSTLLLAPQNVGKTTTLITIAAHNIKRKKSVLFLTHEGVDEDIAEKIWVNMVNRNTDQIRDIIKAGRSHPEWERITHALGYIRAYLTYIPMNRAGLTVEEVAATIRRKQEDRIITSKEGKGYDLLIDDYPAKLLSKEMGSGIFTQTRTLHDFVYNYFVNLALECRFHYIGAIQANRTGAKINRHDKGMADRLLIPEDVNEAYGPIQTATNVVTLNRDPISEMLDFITFYLGKSRSSEKGWAVVCKSSFGVAKTHSDKLGAIWYKGNTPLGEQIGSMFEKYKNVGEIRNLMSEAST